jgi:hypothetical protein
MVSDKAGIGRCGFAGPSSKLRDKPAEAVMKVFVTGGSGYIGRRDNGKRVF